MSSLPVSVLVAALVFTGGMVLFTEHANAPFYYHQDEPGKVLQVIHRRKNFHHPLLMLSTAEVARKALLHGGAEDAAAKTAMIVRAISTTRCSRSSPRVSSGSPRGSRSASSR
ncbi:MAG TPA: hypothetical protein VNE71_01900 [Myxococcota bacterium]|nr:hypothetical protein [Myxococcota bacterium]